MALDSKCKICRRAKEKLFLKGERCYTPKCAMIKKPYPPGNHGQKGSRRVSSEYGMQLREKQKMRFLYGVPEKQFSNYVQKALTSSKKDVGTTLLSLLESRLDNVVYRLGFAISRSIARKLVNHGHIAVNKKIVTIPSYSVKKGEKIMLSPDSAGKGLTVNLDIHLKKYTAPEWLELDKETKEGVLVGNPSVDEFIKSHNIKSIIEYYSR